MTTNPNHVPTGARAKLTEAILLAEREACVTHVRSLEKRLEGLTRMQGVVKAAWVAWLALVAACLIAVLVGGA